MHNLDGYRRFAVFYTCSPDAPLACFGASWLGWDSAVGKKVAQPTVAQMDLDQITKAPRKYGFHATIKAPFRLKDGADAWQLMAAFAAVCADLDGCALPGLHLVRLGRFLALVPESGETALQTLSGHVVQGLDDLRAPLTADEIARRNPERLTPRQNASLERWGYPFVMEDFRFHMTLTDRLPKATSALAQAWLSEHLGKVTLPDRIDALTLMGEDATGQFHQIKRNTLG